MSSRLDPISASASSSLATHPSSAHTRSQSRTQPAKAWVDPASLPDYGVDTSSISGNVPDYVKQLNSNTYFSYGVGDEDSFGYRVGKAVKFVEVNVDRRIERQDRLEATTVAEVLVTKRESTIALNRSIENNRRNRYAEWGRNVTRWMRGISG
jgi:acyl-coenzyme A thioesterase 13